MPGRRLGEICQIGLDFFEFLRETNRASITERLELREIYNKEFRSRNAGTKDPNFGSVLYGLKMHNKITRRRDNIRFNSTVTSLYVDQWRSRGGRQSETSCPGADSPGAERELTSGDEAVSGVRARRRLASLLVKKLKTQRSMGCVLMVPLVTEVVKKERSVDQCQAAITYLTRTCNPDELLHSLLEVIKNIGPGEISETIVAALPHLQTALFRLEDRKAAAMGSALSALQEQLSRLPVPYSRQQEEADEFGLCRCCSALAEFTKPFTEEVTRKNGKNATRPEREELRTELFKFCMKSLRDPLLDAELNRDRKSLLWFFATEIMVTLAAIRESLPGLLFFTSVKRSTQTDDSQSTACLAYLLFVQLMTIESFPAVFSPVFVLQCNMDHTNQLLSSKKESHLLKGLALFAKSLDSVQDNSLPASLLELRSFYSVPQNLRKVLIECPLQHLRESGLKVFQLFINKLDAEAKHKFFRCMLKTSNHAGVEGYITKNIRNQVEFSLQPGNANKWFAGEELVSLLGLVLCLPHGADTDLLNGMDRVMESLSLLRYLLLREKELRNPPGVWDELCRIKDQYLKKLRVCIGISRAYYSAELKSFREDQKLKAKEARDAVISTRIVKSLKVKREKVSSMSPEVQYQVLQSALVTFDLMESLVVRIEEIAMDKQRASI